MKDYTQFTPTRYGEMNRPRRSRAKKNWWLFGGIGAITILCCGGILGFFGYVGVYGPDTSVYAGNRIPTRFLNTMREVGALEPDENILYFYSDAIIDIRKSFYFVSDKKVAIYSETSGQQPLTAISFDEIVEFEFYRNESFFEDSQITLTLADGTLISFPVSSEYDRDQKFFDAIRARTPSSGPIGR